MYVWRIKIILAVGWLLVENRNRRSNGWTPPTVHGVDKMVHTIKQEGPFYCNMTIMYNAEASEQR